MGILADLSELYAEGGITVCTPEDSVLVRSVIQPDADILTWVSPDVFENISIWETHLGQVRQKFNFAQRIRLAIRYSYYLTPLPGVVGSVMAIIQRDYLPLVFSLGVSLLPFVGRLGLIALLKFYIQRKIDQFMSG